MRSSSSSFIPSFRFISFTSQRCMNSCFSAANTSFRPSSRCWTMAISVRASSSSFLKRLSFSALCASRPRVFRASRTSLRRKHTYGSPSSVSCPVSNCKKISAYIHDMVKRDDLPLKLVARADSLKPSAAISNSHIFLLQRALTYHVSCHRSIPPFPGMILQVDYRQQQMAVLPVLSLRKSSSPPRIGSLCIVLRRPASGSLSSTRHHPPQQDYTRTHCSLLRSTRIGYTSPAAKIQACRACHIGLSSGQFRVLEYVSELHFRTLWHLLQLANGIPNHTT
ncbi:uncharacterized protein TERG_12430 [Trichophyton rubrum CBS 118892]|uniref:Uncharacterized protein n=1 Tax=Trichophyton rubrum (strain ATCC MYA-4607 / CBS 118892) TaxID=559305 RepID=A0A080WNF8_TRIRC|nr:uncharacterized protein TERG_12430 [Trichophyton rubrum CBS 118892]KFL62392.1 hypothetical protein TERG_12430 [Trichophyton rubrum CBS 118892]